MKRSIAIVILCWLVITAPLADEYAANSGFIPGRLARIEVAVEQEIKAGKIAGAVALISRNGATVYHKAFGYADIESKELLRTDHIFRIASMTKAITSVGIMILYEQGRFLLNDPVSDFIPEFAEMQVVSEVNDDGSITSTKPAENPIRIIDLLTHSSGISYPFIPGNVQKAYLEAGVIDGFTSKNLRLEDQMKLLARQPLLFEPGSAFAYGLNVDLLGYLIEVISGQPLDKFLAEHITGPLGMADTWFYLPDELADRLVTLYAHVDDKGLVVSDGTESDLKLDNPNYPIEGAKTYFSGGAGLSSTAYDYARFTQMLLNEGELDSVRILGRKSVELMRSARIDWSGDGVADIGLGFFVVDDLGKYGELGSVGAYGWGGAFNTTYWIDPLEDLTAVLMTQARPVDSNIRKRFITLVYQALK